MPQDVDLSPPLFLYAVSNFKRRPGSSRDSTLLYVVIDGLFHLAFIGRQISYTEVGPEPPSSFSHLVLPDIRYRKN